jgi:S-adenosylmethionine synthetase
MNTELIRTAEFVLPGHPDKLADAIADAIVTEAMRLERRALVGVEVALHRNAVFIDGRVACEGAEHIDFARIVTGIYGSAGYSERFTPVPEQVQLSTDLCLGPLWPGEAEFREVADDQSIVTGYACSTPGTEMLPVEHALVRRLAIRLARLRHDQPQLLLGPDAKLIVLVRESSGGTACTLERISVSQQHAADWHAVRGRRAIETALRDEARAFAACVPGMRISRDLHLQLNDAGNFVEGGPHGDNGLSGKKLVCDFYGPRVPIGGGAMSGKDLWKVDRAGPLIARNLAIAGVQRLGLAECTVTLVICPGDRAFRVASVVGPHGVTVPTDAVQLIEKFVDLRLASQGESNIGSLVNRARWGHFAELPKLNTTRFTRRQRQARRKVVANV